MITKIYQTEVIRLSRKSVLSKFNKRTGWFVNWSKFEEDVEIYALVLEGTFDVQGLIAISYDDVNSAVHINWACTAPQNNVWIYGKQKFSGVGGHLFAIAGDLSVRRGYEGFVYGEAMDKKLLDYYCDNFGAEYFPSPKGPYGVLIPSAAMENIMEVYSYAWSNENL